MPTTQKNTDITIRGGLIYVTNPDKHHLPERHQPNTPSTKKKVVVKDDHQIPPATAAAAPDPPPTEPVEETENEPVETSESD